MGNFRDRDEASFSRKHFLSDVGAEVRLQLFTLYRIPMRMFFHVAHPLNREREREWRRQDLRRIRGLSPQPPGVRITPEEGIDPELIDRWRYYFGFTI